MWGQDTKTIASFSNSSHEGWTINNADYATANGGYYKLTSSDASIVTPAINWSNYTDVTITISARKFGGPDATQGKITVSQGQTELASYSPTGTSIVASSALSISPADGTITISCPGASSGKGCGVQTIVIQGKLSASGPINPIITISSENIAVGATATISAPEELSVSYESNKESVARVSAEGVVTGVATGEATITASWEATDTYNAGTKQFTVTVVKATTYEKVTSTNQLVAGNEYILVATGYNRAMGAQGDNIRGYVDVTISDDKVFITNEAVTVLTLGGSTGAWTFLASDNNKYLALTTGSNEIHVSDDASLQTSQWVITSDFQLQNASFTTRVLKYNSGSPRFACYTSGQQNAVLFVKSGGAVDTKAEAGFSFSAATAEATLGEEFEAPTFNNPNNVEVVFDSSEPTVATVDATTGAITILAAGTTTIRATSEANDTYKAGSASYTLTVTDPNQPGTENKPYTVAQAIEATPTSGKTENVYIKGIVSAFYNTSIVGDGSNYRYYISDDGTTDNQLLVYKGKGLNNVAFSDADDLLVGDEVVVLGDLTMYSNAPEVASGNYIVSLNRPEDTTPKITVAPAEVEETADETEGTLTVTYKNVGTDAVQIKFCDANGTDATYDWIAAVFNADKNIEYVISANTGDERTAYLRVYGLDAGTNDVYSNVVTITQAAPITGVAYKLANAIIPGKHYLIASGTDGNVYAMGSQKSTNRNAVAITASNGTIIVPSTKEVYEVQIEVDKDGYFTLFDAAYNEEEGGYLYAAGGTGSNHLKTKVEVDNTAQWIITFDDSNVATIKANMTGRNWMRFNNGNSKIFSCYTSGQEDIYLFERVDDTSRQLTLPVAPAKTYTSFCRAYDLDFTNVEGIEAYVVSDLTDNSAVVTKVDKVAAGEGVILKKTGTAASFEIPFAESAEKVSGNLMVGVTKATDMTKVENAENAYILSDGLFYKCSGGTLAAGKAYLVAVDWAGSNAPSFSIVEGGEATGINSLTPALSQGEEVYYDLSGRRVEKPTKGVYIVNGKKVILK